MQKLCPSCKTTKDTEEFWTVNGKPAFYCIICAAVKNKATYQKHRVRRIRETRKYRQENRKLILKRAKINYQKNKDIIKKRNYAYKKRRIATDPLFKLICNLRRRLSLAVTSSNCYKQDKTLNLIGCSPQRLKQYIESKFQDGMNWNNYGYGIECWHLDHIKPCAAFDLSTKAGQLACFNYTNLQPLWHQENLRKASRY